MPRETRGNPPEGVTDWKLGKDGRLICIVPQLMGGGLITRAEVRDHAPTDEILFYDEGWRYQTFLQAMGAFLAWDGLGEPPLGKPMRV